MNKVKWVQVAVFGFVVLVVFLMGGSLLSPGWGGWGPGGVMGGMMGPGMMGGWSFGPFGWFFMLLWPLFPLSLLALLVLGIGWLFRQVSGPSARIDAPPQAALGQTCANCGRPVQADWRLCPHCGQELA